MAGQNKSFIKKEVAEILGLKPSLIQFYTDQGVITPEVSAPSGRGTRRRYSKRNLLEILIAKRLVERGLSLNEAKSVLQAPELLSRHLSFNKKELPPGFPPQEKHRLIERERLHKMFYDIDSWDHSHDVFLSIHHKKGFLPNIELCYLPREGDMAKGLSENITRQTQALIIINVTDLVERMAEL